MSRFRAFRGGISLEVNCSSNSLTPMSLSCTLPTTLQELPLTIIVIHIKNIDIATKYKEATWLKWFWRFIFVP